MVTQLDLDDALLRVEECEVAIAGQLQLISELRRDGKRLIGAESVLQALNLALLNLCDTRDEIGAALAKLSCVDAIDAGPESQS